jgi:hypothetical protein
MNSHVEPKNFVYLEYMNWYEYEISLNPGVPCRETRLNLIYIIWSNPEATR